MHGIEAARLGHAIESRCSAHCIRAHVRKKHPVSIIKLGHLGLFNDAVKAIACRAPDTAGVRGFTGITLLIYQILL